MFHNNYRIYQINFNEYNIEIQYMDEHLREVYYIDINVNRNQLDKIVELLNGLDFDDNTPREGE